MIEYEKKKLIQWSRLGQRKLFGTILDEIAPENENMFVIAADVAGSAGLKEFAENHPQKFYNTGISEQNMVAMASGMAMEGKNVFVTSFAPFAALRPYEAIRTLAGYMHLNVKIVALASGFSLGSQGNTHYSLEDIALMRTIPGMTVISPADTVETAKAIEALADYNGPAYLRLTGTPGIPNVYKDDFDFQIGKFNQLREGTDVCILSTGAVANEAIRAARLLDKEGISCSIYDVHTIKPLDTEKIDEIAGQYRMIVTVEEHYLAGGLGSAIAEYLSDKQNRPMITRLGVQDAYLRDGDYPYMLQQADLSANAIKEKIVNDYSRVQ